jgi:hypothetical protein
VLAADRVRDEWWIGYIPARAVGGEKILEAVERVVELSEIGGRRGD